MCYCDGNRKRKLGAGDDCLSVDSKGCRTKVLSKRPRKWKVWEDVRLIVAARRYGISQWKHVAKEVGNARNHMQVLQRWKAIIEPAFSEIKWLDTDDELLRHETGEALETGRSIQSSNWRQLAARIPLRSGPEVESRWYNNLADSTQKLHYTTSNSKHTPQYESILEQDDASHPCTTELCDDTFGSVTSPIRLPQVTNVSTIEKLPDQQLDVVGLDQKSSLSSIDAFDYTSSPLSSATDLILYDDIEHFADLAALFSM